MDRRDLEKIYLCYPIQKRERTHQEISHEDNQLFPISSCQTAQVHDSRNGASLKKTLERMAREYGEEEYLNIFHISVSPIYTLKKKASYLRSVASYQKTHKGKAKTICLLF